MQIYTINLMVIKQHEIIACITTRCANYKYALMFWTFHTKLHNMKALVILSHSWSPFLPLPCLYGKNELLWVSLRPSRVFYWENTPLRLSMQITWPWPPVGSFSHGLITVRQKKMWTKCEHVFVYILLSTCQWVQMALAIERPDILLM